VKILHTADWHLVDIACKKKLVETEIFVSIACAGVYASVESLLRRLAMRSCNVLSVMGTLIAMSCLLATGDDAKEKATKKDRQLYKGTWRVVALEVNGNKSNDDDAKKITVANHTDGTWNIYVDGNEIAKGTSTIDPTKKPKTIDFTPSVGLEAGREYLGIYEIGAKTRKLCFAPPGRDRPGDFSSRPGSEHFLVRFEREKPE
jgi:uncharacterized protein (TIGR03067 family)